MEQYPSYTVPRHMVARLVEMEDQLLFVMREDNFPMLVDNVVTAALTPMAQLWCTVIDEPSAMLMMNANGFEPTHYRIVVGMPTEVLEPLRRAHPVNDIPAADEFGIVAMTLEIPHWQPCVVRIPAGPAQTWTGVAIGAELPPRTPADDITAAGPARHVLAERATPEEISDPLLTLINDKLRRDDE